MFICENLFCQVTIPTFAKRFRICSIGKILTETQLTDFVSIIIFQLFSVHYSSSFFMFLSISSLVILNHLYILPIHSPKSHLNR